MRRWLSDISGAVMPGGRARGDDTLRRVRLRSRLVLRCVRRRVPPGLRLILGLVLILGGLGGMLPVLGFWMLPLGIAIAALDIRPIWRAIKKTANGGDPGP